MEGCAVERWGGIGGERSDLYLYRRVEREVVCANGAERAAGVSCIFRVGCGRRSAPVVRVWGMISDMVDVLPVNVALLCDKSIIIATCTHPLIPGLTSSSLRASFQAPWLFWVFGNSQENVFSQLNKIYKLDAEMLHIIIFKWLIQAMPCT